jgi:hypothetical protein
LKNNAFRFLRIKSGKSKKVGPSGKTLVHFASGGVGHFLRLLGNSINFSKDSGWNLVVSSEYHQPLARLPLDEIFDLQAPLQSATEFATEGAGLEISQLRPVRLRAEELSIAMVQSLDRRRLYSAYLPPRTDGGTTEFTTGDWTPGHHSSSFVKRFPNPTLTALRHLSLSGKFRDFVLARERALDRPFIGVHFRNTDYQSDLKDTLDRLRVKVETTGISTVYWCTDDLSSIEPARKKMGDIEFLYSQRYDFRSVGADSKNLHYGLLGRDSREHLGNTFADLFTLFLSNEIVASEVGSWPKLVALMKSDKPMAEKFFGLTK